MLPLVVVPPVMSMVRVPGDGEVHGAGVEGAAGDGAACGVDGRGAAGDVTVPGSGDGGRFWQEELYLGGGAASATDREGDVGDVPGDGEADDAGGGGVVGDDAVFALGDGAAGVAIVGCGVGTGCWRRWSCRR